MENRRFTRVGYKMLASIYYQDMTILGQVENLSLNGMFIKTSQLLKVFDPVKISIILSETSNAVPINLMGKIIRLDQNGMGIEFVDTDIESFTHLRNILTYNTGDPEKVTSEIYLLRKE